MLIGGAGGTRTPYLILAKDALSLMSYSPASPAGAEDKEKGPSCLDPDLNRWTVKGNLEFLCEPVPRFDRSTE